MRTYAFGPKVSLPLAALLLASGVPGCSSNPPGSKAAGQSAEAGSQSAKASGPKPCRILTPQDVARIAKTDVRNTASGMDGNFARCMYLGPAINHGMLDLELQTYSSKALAAEGYRSIKGTWSAFGKVKSVKGLGDGAFWVTSSDPISTSELLGELSGKAVALADVGGLNLKSQSAAMAVAQAMVKTAFSRIH